MIVPVIIPIQQSSSIIVGVICISGSITTIFLGITIVIIEILKINTEKAGAWASLPTMVIHIGLSLVFGTVIFVLLGSLWSLMLLWMDRW